jgi:hypothetical protein
MNIDSVPCWVAHRATTGVMARALSVWVMLVLGVFIGALFFIPSMDPFFWELLLVAPLGVLGLCFFVIKYALPAILKKHQYILVSGQCEVILSGWVGLKLSYAVIWRICVMTLFAQGVAPWFYLFVFGAPPSYMEALFYVGMIAAWVLCCYAAVLWLFRSPHGKLFFVPAL